MAGNTVVTNAPFPPATTQVGNSPTGTITNLSCAGPCACTIYSAAGVALHSVNSQKGISEALSLSWTGGPPTIVQQTPSSITVTF